ncbi:MAG: hypothetical protein RJB13_10, partial [Pseudomonadota bacterium]
QGRSSFEDVCLRAAQCQKRLSESGVQTGDSVLLLCLPGPDVYPLLLAILAQGLTVVFLEPWIPRGHIDRALKVSGLKFVLADAFGSFWRLRHSELRALPLLRVDSLLSGSGCIDDFNIVPVDPNQIATITFTSGTTGVPKGIARSHRYLWDLHEILERHGGDSELNGPDLSVFPNLALYHMGTGRGSVLVPQNWDVKSLSRSISRDSSARPQSLTCGPAFMQRMLDSNVVFDSVSCINLGGALIDCSLMERVLNAYPDSQVRQIYGGTEVEPVCVVDGRVSLERSMRKGFSQCVFLGKPISELRTRIDSDGILWVSGPNVCGQYVLGSEQDMMNKSVDERDELWHSMGDRVEADSDGYWICGRKNQTAEDFFLEQKLYKHLRHTRAFIHRSSDGRPVIVGEDNKSALSSAGESVFNSRVEVVPGKIVRDRRHRSRIDRATTWKLKLRWIRLARYIKERSPIPILAVLALGPLISGWMFASKKNLCKEECFDARNSYLMFLALVSSLLFLIAARAMDEIKDAKKDKTANPSRPLPRGLITLNELKFVSNVAVSLMLLLCLIFLTLGQVIAASLLFVSTVYLWLMYKEFYVGHRLADYPIIYGFSHQLVVIPLYLFAFTLIIQSSEPIIRSENFGAVPFAFALANLFASMTYEFSRKLQPDKHPDAQTYRQIYGFRKATGITIFFALASVVCFWFFQTRVGMTEHSAPALHLVIVHVLLIAVLVRHIIFDGMHKYAEGIAALLVIATAWHGVVSFW